MVSKRGGTRGKAELERLNQPERGGSGFLRKFSQGRRLDKAKIKLLKRKPFESDTKRVMALHRQ
jgi:hypothetical protein